MIYLFSDFSLNGPYVGQLKSAIYNNNKNSEVIDLMHDAPSFDIKHSALLLNNIKNYLSNNYICCCIVDPGVGGKRNGIVVCRDNNYFIGPDNGLFEYIYRTDESLTLYKIVWKPEYLSETFHGRDIFAPIAAQIDNGNFTGLDLINSNEVQRFAWEDDQYEIIYIDHYGNLMTGISASNISKSSVLIFKKFKIEFSNTYENMPEGQICWYINSCELVEIGCKNSNSAVKVSAQIGDYIELL